VAFLYNRCDAVVAQSSMFFEDIKSLVPRHKNLDFIPSWSDVVSNNYNSDNEIDLKISKLKGEFNIFYTGNIGEAQDFKTIIQAAKILKNEVTIKWFIIGDGRMLEWVKKEVLVNELENTFYLLGAYPIDKMAIFFKHADAGLLCLKNDDVLCKTIPGKLQTYYANNILVVGACNGEVFNIVNNSNSGLICNAGDSQKMAENILFLKSQSKEFLNNLSLNAKRFYENNYEREHVFKMFDDKLKSIIKKSL
jgi:glycosyltransferase involved in cell wall biosynthesis